MNRHFCPRIFARKIVFIPTYFIGALGKLTIDSELVLTIYFVRLLGYGFSSSEFQLFIIPGIVVSDLLIPKIKG